MRLCRNDEGGWIPAESRRGGIRLLSFGIMCWKGLSVGCPALGFYGAPRAEPVVPPCNTLLRQGFGGLSASGDIRRSINNAAHE